MDFNCCLILKLICIYHFKILVGHTAMMWPCIPSQTKKRSLNTIEELTAGHIIGKIIKHLQLDTSACPDGQE